MQKISFFIIITLILELTVTGINEIKAQENSQESKNEERQKTDEQMKMEQKRIEEKKNMKFRR